MAQFGGVDYYNTESLLSSEEKLVRDTVREFVSDEVIPIIEKHFREGTFPIHLVKKMAELGILGPTFRPSTAVQSSTTSHTALSCRSLSEETQASGVSRRCKADS